MEKKEEGENHERHERKKGERKAAELLSRPTFDLFSFVSFVVLCFPSLLLFSPCLLCLRDDSSVVPLPYWTASILIASSESLPTAPRRPM